MRYIPFNKNCWYVVVVFFSNLQPFCYGQPSIHDTHYLSAAGCYLSVSELAQAGQSTLQENKKDKQEEGDGEHMLMGRIIGHRGVANLAPENTLAGIRQAADLGLSWIELDVTLTGDGQAVMFHDESVDRTTSQSGHIKNFSLADLLELDAGSWFAKSFADEKVPTLKQALELIMELGLSLNLELKVNNCDTELLARQAANVLEEVHFPLQQLLVTSFDYSALMHFHGIHEARIGCLFDELPEDWQTQAMNADARSIHANAQHLSQEQVALIKQAGYELYCYTVNDKNQAEELLSWGVNGIFTDKPQLFKDSLN